VIENLMEFSYVPSILIILVVADEYTYFNSERGRYSIFMLFIQQNQVEMQARKLITYHDLHLSLCIHMGSSSIARLQREEMSRSAKEHEELVAFLQESTVGLHSF
jgi:hypothetical protein